MEHLSEYRQAVSAAICAKCIDGDRNGSCRIGIQQECAVMTHLPKIVDAVFSVESEKLEPYIAALRKNVCATCQYEGTNGTCNVRNRIDCALDRYFPMIVETLQETRSHITLTKKTMED